MAIYNESGSMSQGLAHYLALYNLGDGGYTAKTFSVPFFKLFNIKLPNIPNRISAVKFHDLHHVLTEYETGLVGEAEIGAWEIASGCGKYYSAWLLNSGSLLYGIFLCPRKVYKAFMRGRKSKNLYHGIVYEKVLPLLVCDVRRELQIPMNAESI
jgi:hypothetical protein